MQDKEHLEELVRRATEGSREALEAVVRAVQQDVYRLALRMLWRPEDAADAAQEILIRIVTNLGSFRGESSFRTWYFRVASNHLLNLRASRMERAVPGFGPLAETLAAARQEPAAPEGTPEERLLVEEVKLGCTLGILLNLDRPHRLAYILGEILGLSGEEGAAICDVSPVAFRKRLSRARADMQGFLGAYCGLVSKEAPCQCARRVGTAVQAGLLRPERLRFARHPADALDGPALLERERELEALSAEVRLYRSHPDYQAPEAIIRSVKALIDGGSLTKFLD